MSLRNLLAGPFAALTLLAAAPATAQHAKFLVSTDWLEQNLKNPKVRVVEVSVNPGLYERGHIPGAANVSWHTDWSTPSAATSRRPRSSGAAGARRHRRRYHHDPVRRQQQLVRGLGRLGVRHLRHPEREAAGRRPQEMGGRGRPLANSATVHAPGNARVRTPTLRARLQDVLAVARKEKPGVLVDIRSADEYNGKIFAPNGVPELAVRAGHVPGAVNVTWSKLVAEDGTFKSAEELKAIYRPPGWTAASRSSPTAALASAPAIPGSR